MNEPLKTVSIMGSRGIPAAHGGFETFAHEFALHMVRNGWRVIVYCQAVGKLRTSVTFWNGVELRTVYLPIDGTLATMVFDVIATCWSLFSRSVYLVLGYNTAFLSVFYRLVGKKNIINMDGIEWKRQKWRFPYRVWFRLNEFAGAFLGNHLVADHPEIKRHLGGIVASDKIEMIPYGAEPPSTYDEQSIKNMGLSEGNYCVVIARPEPENHILEIVLGFLASAAPATKKLVILGKFDSSNTYHQQVTAYESEKVVFPGAIYDKAVVNALRHYAFCYFHGHSVGGTNPSLVESMANKALIIAHDNVYNRWVTGETGALFFTNPEQMASVLDGVLASPVAAEALREQAYSRYVDHFTLDAINHQYEELVRRYAGQ